MNPWIRPEVMALEPYTLDLSKVPHKLDQNEVPWEVPRRLKLRWMKRMLQEPWHRYPDFHADRLRARLSELHGWPESGILVGNGSNELLQVALFAVAGGGRRVLGLAPSFGLYRGMVTIAGGQYEALGPRADLRLDLDGFEERLTSDPPEVLLINSPNNPTGEAVPVPRLENWLKRISGILLLDQAYVEFSDQNARPMLDRFQNLLLFRTFSKAWGLAGIRLGYLLGPPEVVNELRKVKLPYNLGRAAALAGEIMLGAEGRRWTEQVVRRLRAQISEWASWLAQAGAEVFPSEANFVLTRWPAGTFEEVRRRLEVAGVRVRDVSKGPGLAGCLRISLGSQRDFRALKDALEGIRGSRDEDQGG